MPIPALGMIAANVAAGAATAEMNDARQRKQQGYLQGMQIRGQKELNQENYRLNKKMWDETNYDDQMRELKKAGLNAGLMYGMGGAGGASTAGGGGGSVSGASAPSGGGEIQASIGMGMEMQLLNAQKKNIEADTKLKETEAKKKGGVDTAEAEGRIGIMGVDKILKEIEAGVQGATAEDRIDRISFDTRKAMKELEIATVESGIARETIDEKVKIIEQTAIGAVLQNALTRVQTAKGKQDIAASKAQIEKWSEEIAQGWDDMDRKQQELKLKAWTEELKAQNVGIGDVIGKNLNALIENIDDVMHETKRRRRTYVAPVKTR